MMQKPDTDYILEEIHRTRREIAEKFGGDIAAILADARKRQAESDRPEWRGKSSEAATKRSASGGAVSGGMATSGDG